MQPRILFVCALLAGIGVACAAHDSEGPRAPQRSCAVTIWHKPSSDAAVVEIVGDWNDWARPGRILPASRADAWRATAFDVAPGEHQYAIVEDGSWLADRNVPTTAFHDGHEVTWVDVASCDAPLLRVDASEGTADGHAKIAVSFLASRAGSALDPATISAKTKAGRAIGVAAANPATGAIALAATDLPPGKHTFTLHAKDTHGKDAEDALATVWIEPRPFDLHDAVIYQIMVDRYRNDAGSLTPPSLASGRAGGNIAGVRKAIEAGELTALGVNMVWLSPLYKNPTGTFPGADGRPYTAYHGYWPIDPRALEPAFGTEDDLDALVAAAHERGIRVVFDVVPNHVHEQHPYVAAHAGDKWFNNPGGKCICGVTCDWATHLEDCWFTPYLPDLDWRNPAVADQITSDVRWWIDRFDGDGLRIDAVPMMPRSATRRIANAVRARFEHPGNRMMLLGENFTGPGGYGQLRYELGPFGLDSEFHFPLMWSLRHAIAEAAAPLSDIDATLKAGDAAWNGSGAVMALMIGNHDVTRFASDSAGNAGGDGWVAVQQPADPLVYAKQQMALAVVYTLPGVPVVYYGDEVGLAGRGDPDSRRVMPAEAALLPEQTHTRDLARILGRARSCSEALRRGRYRVLYADAERLAYARESEGAATAIVILTRSPSGPISVPLPGIPAENYIDVLAGRQASLSPELTNLAGAPFSAELFFPVASPCAHP